ncbi:hypothetical protein [Nocardia sp. NPDC004860]|uniref:hypothetical protein n=1 Tax=Nocardia sp. NPDC004860 TaxID=3154557 RepID=UPI0033A959CB
MFKSAYVPVVGWSIILQDYDPATDGPRWCWWRGRCRELNVRMPLWRWTVEIAGRGKSYRDLVGLQIRDLDWVIDEFDASFNELAVASLKYHMDHSVCFCSPERRVKYQTLIDRLSEEPPHVCDTPEKQAVFAAACPRGAVVDSEAVKPIFADFRRRETEYLERVRQARHAFVDIMPELWS